MDIEEMLECINDEPEFPGVPPEELIQAWKHMVNGNDIEGLIEYSRIIVRLTKKGIKERIKEHAVRIQEDSNDQK